MVVEDIFKGQGQGQNGHFVDLTKCILEKRQPILRAQLFCMCIQKYIDYYLKYFILILRQYAY